MIDPRAYHASAVERAMKVQGVILRALDGQGKRTSVGFRIPTMFTSE